VKSADFLSQGTETTSEPSMKKVLFIYYFFPPLMGDWRGVGFARFLPEFGWQPIVISAADCVSYRKDYSLLKMVPAETRVHRVGHREPKLKEWQYALNKFRINYIFPDEYKSWYSPAIQQARKVLRQEKIDLIFSSSSPSTSAFIAMKLKEEFNIPWVAEWRDLWSANTFTNRNYDKMLIKPLRQLQRFQMRVGERDILRRANKTVVVSQHHREQLGHLHGAEEGRITVITNGYDEPDFTELKPSSIYPGKMTITFLGTVYSPFQESIDLFLRTVTEIDKYVEVVFIGRGAADMQGTTMENLTLVLHLVKEKALSFASGSDFLFLVMPPNAKWIPGKIFEYLRLGKPILALVPEDGDVATIVNEARAGFVLSYDPEKLKQQLTLIFQGWKTGEFKGFRPDWEYVAQFERRNLTKQLAECFDSAGLK